MEKGRLSEHIRKRAVCPRLGYESPLHDKEAGAGRETAFFSLKGLSLENADKEAGEACKDSVQFVTTQETLAAEDKEAFAELLVTGISNQLLSAFASPIGIMVEILLPVGYTEMELRYMMEKLSAAAKRHSLDLAAVDTHCTDAVNLPVAAAFGVGRKNLPKAGCGNIDMEGKSKIMPVKSAPKTDCENTDVEKEEKKESAFSSEIKKDNTVLYEIKKNPERYSIIMAGLCGALGTRLLYQKKELREGFSEQFLKNTEEIFKDLSVKEAVYTILGDSESKESRNAACMSAGGKGLGNGFPVNSRNAAYMRAGGETGVFGALWDLSEDLKTGFRVELEKIPIRQETIELCEKENVSPYEINAEGCILAVTDRPGSVLEALLEKGILAADIGYLSGRKEKCILGEKLPGEEREIRFLDSPRA